LKKEQIIAKNLIFKKFDTSEVIDLIPYLKNFLIKNPKSLMVVGSDSLKYKIWTTYSTIIALFYPKIIDKNTVEYTSGAHLLYTKHRLTGKTDMWTRLWREVELTQLIADYIEVDVFNTDLLDTNRHVEIHVDLNPNEDYESNKIFKATMGMFKAMGYNTKAKPDSFVATCAADILVR
jgi:predicted RNase H-related nuclease YkuK (DUF458 family)